MADIAAHGSMRKVPVHVVEAVAEHIARRVVDSAGSLPKLFEIESPIEAALGFALWHLGGSVVLSTGSGFWEYLEHDKLAIAVPQKKILNYRVDFLVETRCGKKFVVECDGHEFHERTKLQAARDRKRDRAFAAAGIPVLRFTGSEIWADAIGCAEVIGRFAELTEWDQVEEIQ